MLRLDLVGRARVGSTAFAARTPLVASTSAASSFAPRSCVALALALAGVAGVVDDAAVVAQTVVAAPPASAARWSDAVAEFPPQEAYLTDIVTRAAAAKAAARALREAPDDPATVGPLMRQERMEEALALTRRIVDTQPARIAATFEQISVSGFLAFRDMSRGYPARIQDLATAARLRIAGLAREERAEAERQLIAVESQFGQRDRERWLSRLHGLVQDHPGTQAALLAEVDAIGADRLGPEVLDALDRFAQAHPGTTAAAKARFTKALHLGHNAMALRRPPRAGGDDPTERLLEVAAIAADLESGRYPPCEWVDKAPTLVSQFMIYEPSFTPETLARTIGVYQAFVRARVDLGGLGGADADGRARGAPRRPDEDVGQVLIGRLPELLALQGEAVAGMERTFDDLERRAAAAGNSETVASLRFMRAQFYLQSSSDTWRRLASSSGPPPEADAEPSAERAARLRKAVETFSALQAAGTGPSHRRALAALASLHMQEREYAAAREGYRRYVVAYPTSAFAWVAALRVGQADEALDDWKAAASAHRATASAYALEPMARVLGQAYAGRADEASGDFAQALAAYRRAVEDWDLDYGTRYTLSSLAPPSSGDPFQPRRDANEVVKASLSERIASLERTLARPGGAQLARARWLIEQESYDEAIGALSSLLARPPSSSPAVEAKVPAPAPGSKRPAASTRPRPQSDVAPATEARRLLHRARLERALGLANVEGATPDDAAAVRELEALVAEQRAPRAGETSAPDVAIFAARVALASIRWKRGGAPAESPTSSRTIAPSASPGTLGTPGSTGSPGAVGAPGDAAAAVAAQAAAAAAAQAEAAIRDALEALRLQQRAAAPPAPQDALERDVAEIRQLVFRPAADGVFAGPTWEAFRTSPAAPPAFLIADPDVEVRFPTGDIRRVSLPQPIAGLDTLVYLDADGIALLERIIVTLGGTRRRTPDSVMQVPNQPVGPSLDILALWKALFFARPGHWGGWMFRTPPEIRSIEFLDAARTQARANVTIGYEGAKVVLEKRGGVWVATRLTDRWIT